MFDDRARVADGCGNRERILGGQVGRQRAGARADLRGKRAEHELMGARAVGIARQSSGEGIEPPIETAHVRLVVGLSHLLQARADGLDELLQPCKTSPGFRVAGNHHHPIALSHTANRDARPRVPRRITQPADIGQRLGDVGRERPCRPRDVLWKTLRFEMPAGRVPRQQRDGLSQQPREAVTQETCGIGQRGRGSHARRHADPLVTFDGRHDWDEPGLSDSTPPRLVRSSKFMTGPNL